MKSQFKVYYLLLFIFTVIGCTKKNGSDINKSISWQHYSADISYSNPEIKNVIDDLELDDQCIIKIDLIFPSTDKDKYDLLTKDLHNFLLDRFTAFEEVERVNTVNDEDPQTYVDGLANYLQKTYMEDTEDLIKSGLIESESSLIGIFVREYYIRDTILYNDNGIISIGTNNYEYSGGAHGMSLFTARNYDLMNNSPITPSTLFQDPTSNNILEAIKAQLLADYSVESIDELQQETGIFSLTDSKVVLSNEIYFSESGITFYYNPYEIAPYAYGSTEVTVPYSVLAPYLTAQYQFLGDL